MNEQGIIRLGRKYYMVDNFNQIKNYLVFDSEDDFYHLQIIKRKKDNPGLTGRNNNARCMKTYYVTSVEYLEEKQEEILALCKIHNARACINLNRRSFEQIAFQTMIKITGQIMSKDFKSVRRAYDSVCGAFSHERKDHKTWIIDIDDLDTNLAKIIEDINKIEPITNRHVATIPTKNGFHLIVRPFNVMEFFKIHASSIDIHKDNPTCLFIP
jgi:hypothetical protein